MARLLDYGTRGWAFLVGVGSVLNIFPTVPNPAKQSDASAIGSDWHQVGEDLRLALQALGPAPKGR